MENNEDPTATPKLEALMAEEEDGEDSQHLDEFLNSFKRWMLGKPNREQTAETVGGKVIALQHQVDSMQRMVQNMRSSYVDIDDERRELLQHFIAMKKIIRRMLQAV